MASWSASPCAWLVFMLLWLSKWPGFSNFVSLQVKRMIRMCHSEDQAKEILKDRLRMFMMIRPEASLDAEYFKRRLLKFRLRAKTTVTNPLDGYTGPPTMLTMTPAHDRKVCLALDESGMSGKGLDDFFKTVKHAYYSYALFFFPLSFCCGCCRPSFPYSPSAFLLLLHRHPEVTLCV